jgi:hypothetical protein
LADVAEPLAGIFAVLVTMLESEVLPVVCKVVVAAFVVFVAIVDSEELPVA